MFDKRLAKKNETNNPEFITTTELAKLCGVSRFTVINWVKSGRIKTITTFGGHRRIPRSEVDSVLKVLNLANAEAVSEEDVKTIAHCWQLAETMKCNKKCSHCLAYIRKLDYCFLLVQKFGKQWLECEGTCHECVYFNSVFESMDKMRTRTVTEKIVDGHEKDLNNNEDYIANVSFDIGRGIHGFREKVNQIRDVVMDKMITKKKNKALDVEGSANSSDPA
jgi:excisionase family DNA binding protein